MWNWFGFIYLSSQALGCIIIGLTFFWGFLYAWLALLLWAVAAQHTVWEECGREDPLNHGWDMKIDRGWFPDTHNPLWGPTTAQWPKISHQQRWPKPPYHPVLPAWVWSLYTQAFGGTQDPSCTHENCWLATYTYVSSTLLEMPSVFHSDCISFHSCHSHITVLIIQHLLQHSVLSDFILSWLPCPQVSFPQIKLKLQILKHLDLYWTYAYIFLDIIP